MYHKKCIFLFFLAAVALSACATGPDYGAGYAVQARYGNAYVQCMYAKGNQIPGVTPSRRQTYPPPPPTAGLQPEVTCSAPRGAVCSIGA